MLPRLAYDAACNVQAHQDALSYHAAEVHS